MDRTAISVYFWFSFFMENIINLIGYFLYGRESYAMTGLLTSHNEMKKVMVPIY